MNKFVRIKSIAEIHRMFSLPTPKHPLISIIKQWPKTDFDFKDVKISSDLYLLSMKGKTIGTAFNYGRNSYDFEEGMLVFMAPGQVASFPEPIEELDNSGWTILFHPDLIRRSALGKAIDKYSFFSYDTHEALHLSEKEKEFLIQLVEKIESELEQNLDKHSQELIIHNIETILKYSDRYYDRQFFTRTNLNRDYVTQFEEFLNQYFASAELSTSGIPTLTRCGEALNMSGSYLSDLLKTETGRGAKDHIHSHIIDKAKTELLGSRTPISQIAFNLGFEYPQHFSKLFKSRTAMSPSEYRSLN